MDYSNFIKNIYRHAFTELKKHKNYYGKVVNVSYGLDIPEEFLHAEESESMFLPSFSLNINAPTKYFVTFMDYYVTLMPELGIVFADDIRIKKLYNRVVDMNILEDDDKVMRFIELMVGVGIETLKIQGILE